MPAAPDPAVPTGPPPHLTLEPAPPRTAAGGFEDEITPGTLEYTAGLIQWAWGESPPQARAERQLWYSCRAVHLLSVPAAQQAGVKAALRPLNHPQIIDQYAKIAGGTAALLGMYLLPLLSGAGDTSLFGALPIGAVVGVGVWWAARDALWNAWSRSMKQLSIIPPARPPAFEFKRRPRRRGRT